jgi:hypothetical protein
LRAEDQVAADGRVRPPASPTIRQKPADSAGLGLNIERNIAVEKIM